MRQRAHLLREILCHGFLQQMVVTLLADDTHLAATTPEEDVKHQPHHRQKHQYQHPRKCLHRIPIVENNDGNRTDDGAEVEYVKQQHGDLIRYGTPVYHEANIEKSVEKLFCFALKSDSSASLKSLFVLLHLSYSSHKSKKEERKNTDTYSRNADTYSRNTHSFFCNPHCFQHTFLIQGEIKNGHNVAKVCVVPEV